MMPRRMYNPLRDRLLDEPIVQGYGSNAETGSTHRHSQFDSFTQSSPPILEPSKDAPRPPKPTKPNDPEDSSSPPIDPWRTLVTTSCNEPMMSRPVTYRDPPSEDQPPTCCCSTFVSCYGDAASKFKNSNFMYVFQVLLSIIPISAIAMGLIFLQQCSVSGMMVLPVWGAVEGLFGVVFIVMWMIACYYISSGRSDQMLNICTLLMLGTIVFFTVTDVCMYFATSASFDEKSAHYCNRTFYYYVFYKQIAIGVAVFLSAMLYLPTYIQWVTSS